MLLAPWKRHRPRRQPIPEPAPWRWCTLRTHLFSSLLCSSLVSGSLVASTPTWNKHTFTHHRTKSSFRTESCSSSWKKPMEIISIPATMKPCGRREVPAKWCATWMHRSPPESAWVVTRWFMAIPYAAGALFLPQHPKMSEQAMNVSSHQ